MSWLEFVLYSYAVYRVTRFIGVDSLLKEPRDKLARWLINSGDNYVGDDDEVWPTKFWKRKLLQWLECPFCQSVWVAAAAVGFWCVTRDEWLGWRYLEWWIGISGSSMMIYKYVDPSPPCIPSEVCDH